MTLRPYLWTHKGNTSLASPVLEWGTKDRHVAQSTLRTLAPRKEDAVAEAKQSIDRLLASIVRH
jgi:hypothetical protein